MNTLLVMFGGAAGALGRYYLERWSVRRFRERIPYGTAIANLVGALLLGLIVAAHAAGHLPEWALLLIGTGFCGALTTFSGFMGQVENRLRHRNTRSLALRYGIGVTMAGLALAWFGLQWRG